MFFTLILENSSGDRIDMTTTANQYMTSKISGLPLPPGTVSTSSYVGMDGTPHRLMFGVPCGMILFCNLNYDYFLLINPSE